ncbi:hypothetical protein LOY37_18055 [Pseudomonas sp. B21-012]|uniref:hypothetical protein n=1 Tax=unclassified Pseudomonas TaxID=196821 RepID=UPI00088B60ED|nr:MULTISPECIES: hypothetical protein [unclassified Pseudomonas]UVL54704.1 hypothetical protein LOY22_17785 [Pseudomonas sp. B21-035]UVM54255.1 hypothetical protein LOY37_18055 [Pseudomonas sp. B21-012]SDQ55360.1 hypothetical protein SAMN05216487_2476 [Pseudomonas sp. UC 17F4]
MNSPGKGLPETFLQAAALREHDRYPEDMDWQALVHAFFPDSVVGMAQSLSNITGAFYGLMLEQAGEMFGREHINRLSERMFYRLGRRMAARHMASQVQLERDARGLGRLVVAAIFTSSPEYRLHILEFGAEQVFIRITGADRYHRIARELGFEDVLQWPVLREFFRGLGDELGITERFALAMELVSLDDDSRCDYSLAIVRRSDRTLADPL